jgi:hypothetical protein
MKLQKLSKKVGVREKQLSKIIYIARDLATTYGTISNPYEGELSNRKPHHHIRIELSNFGNFDFIVNQDCNFGDNGVNIFFHPSQKEVFSIDFSMGTKVKVFDESSAWEKILDLTWKTRKQIAKSTNRSVKMVKMRLVQKRLTVKEFTKQYNALLEKAKELGMTV